MKMVDDKLRIIDDVPSSAVEMAVKEKVCYTITLSCINVQLWNVILSHSC